MVKKQIYLCCIHSNSNSNCNTVKPLSNGHPQCKGNRPSYTGVRLEQVSLFCMISGQLKGPQSSRHYFLIYRTSDYYPSIIQAEQDVKNKRNSFQDINVQIVYINYTGNSVEKKSLIEACFLRCSLTSCSFSVILQWPTDTAFLYRQRKKQNPVTGLTSALQQQKISEGLVQDWRYQLK